MLFSSGKSVVGLDLDHGELRAMELGRGKAGFQLLNWGRAPLPPEVLGDGLILQTNPLGQALERFWSEQRFKSRNVVIGVSNKDVLVRFTEFPEVPHNKMESMIKYHIKDLLPISLDDAVMDFSVIGPAGEKEKTQEVLLVATQRDMLNNFLEVLTRARLNPLDINVIPLALQHLIPQNSEGNAIIVLDLANGSSNILVTAGGKPRLARRLSSRLQDMAERLYCSLDEVVDRSGATPGEIFSDAFIDWGETLVGELRSSISYYQSQPGTLPVGQLLLSGRGASIAGFAKQLQEIFEVPVVPVNLLQFLEKAPPEDAFSEADAADYGLCFALARGGLGGN